MQRSRSSKWLVSGAIGLIAIGALIAAGWWINVNQTGGLPTPLPRSITIDLPDVPQPEIARVPLKEAYAAQQAHQAVFIDVRDTGSYERGHIPGALSFPYGELGSHLEGLNKQQWIITYCA